MKIYEHIGVYLYRGIIYYNKKEETSVIQMNESQKHVLSKRWQTHKKSVILCDSIYFKFKKRQTNQNKTSFIVLEVRIEFTSELGRY